MWKRYETRTKEPPRGIEKETAEGQDSEKQLPALGEATNTPRPVKRLRLKNVPVNEREGKENKTAQYFTTLRDGVAGTPRSEYYLCQRCPLSVFA